MNRDQISYTRRSGPRPPPASAGAGRVSWRLLLLVTAAAGLLLCLWLAYALFAPGKASSGPVEETAGEQSIAPEPQPAAEVAAAASDETQRLVGAATATQPVAKAAINADTNASAANPTPTPDVPPSVEQGRQLMAQLAGLGSLQGGITLEQAPGVKKLLTDLAKQGPEALPAIKEFLAQHIDLAFDAPGVAKAVGTTSLRQGLLDILQAIPGQESVEIAAETLQKSPFPEEIAKLMSILEKQSPGTYRAQGITAARESLTLAAAGQLSGQKVSPAFEILQTYGDASVIPDLQAALKTKWRQNAALALSELPDGIGIPVLVELANDPSVAAYGRGDLALRPLAQVSLRYPAAFEALLAQAQQNKIPDAAWPTVVSALAGNDYISNGQVLPDTRSPSVDLNQLLTSRIALLDRLAAMTASPAARQLLAEQRAALSRRIR